MRRRVERVRIRCIAPDSALGFLSPLPCRVVRVCVRSSTPAPVRMLEALVSCPRACVFRVIRRRHPAPRTERWQVRQFSLVLPAGSASLVRLVPSRSLLLPLTSALLSTASGLLFFSDRVCATRQTGGTGDRIGRKERRDGDARPLPPYVRFGERVEQHEKFFRRPLKTRDAPFSPLASFHLIPPPSPSRKSPSMRHTETPRASRVHAASHGQLLPLARASQAVDLTARHSPCSRTLPSHSQALRRRGMSSPSGQLLLALA